MIERIIKQAREQNGWVTKGVVLFDHSSPRGAQGVILFEHPGHRLSGEQFGTATIFTDPVEDAPVGFEWGHYDLNHEEGLKDLNDRIERGF